MFNPNQYWNEFEYQKPPNITIPTPMAHQVMVLHPALDLFFRKKAERDAQFAETAALLSRLMARRKNSFRRMMGFQLVQKLNASLCRLLRLDLDRDLETFRGALPDFMPNTGAKVELPSRNFIDYLLRRLLACYQLHLRIDACCTEGGAYFSDMLRQNFFFEISTLFLAVLAKTHNQNIAKCNKIVDLYHKLQPLRESFPVLENVFLPPAADLPCKLERIKSSTLDKKDESVTTTAGSTTVTLKALAPVLTKAHRKVDVGTAVERKPQRRKFDIQELHTVDDVNAFIKEEEKARTKSPKDCVTRNLQSHEWLGAKKLFHRKVLANDSKKALHIFCKFLGSKL